MKKTLLFLISIYSLCLLCGCAGGSSTPPPPPPSVATHFSVTAPLTATAGTAFNITVTALDASNSMVSSYSGTVQLTSNDGQPVQPPNAMLTSGTGTFSVTLKAVGSPTITATAASITGTSSSITVSGVTGTTHFAVTSAPTTAIAGTAFNFNVSARDASNNVNTSYAGTVQFTSSDAQAVFPVNSATLTNGTGTFSAILETLGYQTIKATDAATSSIKGISIPIKVLGPPATHFSVIAPANATVGTAFDITVTALDASNMATNNYSGTLHFISTDLQADKPADSLLTNGAASFSAGLKTPGNQTITATDNVTLSITGTSTVINVSAATAANPVPLIYQLLSPNAVLPGVGLAFKLSVNGTGFVFGSTVKWNGSARATNFVSNSNLTATILALDVAQSNTASVTVVNPAPGGGTSNVVFFETTRPTSSVALVGTSGLASSFSVAPMASGDFNGDGKLDLVATNANGNISVLLGQGDGTFQAPVDYPAGVGPTAIAVGDFNGDGKLDLVVANTDSNNVSVLLGNGDGTFQPAVEFVVGSDPRSVAVGDFNGDGKLDIVVGNSGATSGISNLSVLLGNGDGTLQPALTYDAGFGITSVAVGDFNGDDKLDLVVVNFGRNVSILLGNGDGTFQSAVNYAAGPVPLSVAVGDFNGDGKLDMAVANIPSGNVGPTVVSVLLGNGDGTFQSPADYGTGSIPNSDTVALGDFNGDGKLDMAVTGYHGTNDVSILLGNGDGTFQSAVNYADESSSLVVGDFNGDGRLDIALDDGIVLLQPGLVSGQDAILSPNTLTFAAQLLSTTSPAQSIQLTNYGTATLNIAGITVTTNYNETDTCGSSLTAGASCFISVTFTPSALGTLSGTLSINDDAPGSPQTVSLGGMGTEVELSPTSLRFGCAYQPGPNGVFYFCSGPQRVTVTNVGPTTLVISAITITGPLSESNTCVTSLGQGQSCTITVTWPSSHNVGNGVLSISDNGGASPQTVPLSAFAQRR